MAVKIMLAFCAQALLLQFAFSQCIGRSGIDGYGWAGPALAPAGLSVPYGCDGLGWAGYPAIDFTPTTGGGLPVTSVSPIQPIGITVVSENTFEGPLMVAGEMPFVAVVALDGVLPSVGSGAINHACGNGISAIFTEGVAPTAYGPYGPALAPAGIGYNYPGCGCGLPY